MEFKKRFDLSGRVAVITGGAGLLGKEHATVIAEAKGIPILADIRGEEAQKTAREISEKFQVPVLGVSLDITREKDVEQLLEKLIEKFKLSKLIFNSSASPEFKIHKGGNRFL